MKQILTIAGSDSGGGAGIQADLKTITMLGAYGASVITAVTAQNTLGVRGVYDVPLEGVAAQLDAVCQDIDFQAVKTGMLSGGATTKLVAEKLRQYRLPNVVVDPVMVATSGDRLLAEDALEALCAELLPCALLATPNLTEAERLTGISIRSREDMRRAGERLRRETGCSNVLVKGGHLEGAEAVDLLCLADGRSIPFACARVETENTHGTGCTLSAALATFLGCGYSVEEATGAAKEYLYRALLYGRADRIGHGHGPVRHNYRLAGTPDPVRGQGGRTEGRETP